MKSCVGFFQQIKCCEVQLFGAIHVAKLVLTPSHVHLEYSTESVAPCVPHLRKNVLVVRFSQFIVVNPNKHVRERHSHVSLPADIACGFIKAQCSGVLLGGTQVITEFGINISSVCNGAAHAQRVS